MVILRKNRIILIYLGSPCQHKIISFKKVFFLSWFRKLNTHTIYQWSPSPLKRYWQENFLDKNPKSYSVQKCYYLVQFSSVAQSCPTLCNPMNHSTPGLPVHHQLPEFTQTHVHWVSDAIQPSHPLSSPLVKFNLILYILGKLTEIITSNKSTSALEVNWKKVK